MLTLHSNYFTNLASSAVQTFDCASNISFQYKSLRVLSEHTKCKYRYFMSHNYAESAK